MTLAQYKAIMDGVNINEDVTYIFTAENTKIMTSVYPKIELDEGNELLKAYILHPKSTEKKPIYVLSFVCTVDSIFAVQFKLKDGVESFTLDKDGNKVTNFKSTLQEDMNSTYLIGNYN